MYYVMWVDCGVYFLSSSFFWLVCYTHMITVDPCTHMHVHTCIHTHVHTMYVHTCTQINTHIIVQCIWGESFSWLVVFLRNLFFLSTYYNISSPPPPSPPPTPLSLLSHFLSLSQSSRTQTTQLGWSLVQRS